MQRTGTVVQVDVSSIAQRNFPSSVFFHPCPPEKEPDTPPCFRRDIGLWVLNLWPLEIQNQAVRLNFIYHLCRPILFQRDDDLPFASPTFQLDSSGHEARQHAAAQATERFYSRVIVAGLILAVLLNHSFLCLAGPYGFLWPSRPKSPQVPEASKLEPPTFPLSDIFPRVGPVLEKPRACSEPIQRLAVP